MVMDAAQIVDRLLEAEDLDAPDLQHWGARLSMEERLTKLYGRSYPHMKNDPEGKESMEWASWFRFGPREMFEVWSTFTLFYKVKDAPSGLLFYDIKWSNWQHHNSEFVHGQYNVLKMIEILEAEIDKLKATPPGTVQEVVRAFEKPLNFAYNKERYGTDEALEPGPEHYLNAIPANIQNWDEELGIAVFLAHDPAVQFLVTTREDGYYVDVRRADGAKRYHSGPFGISQLREMRSNFPAEWLNFPYERNEPRQ